MRTTSPLKSPLEGHDVVELEVLVVGHPHPELERGGVLLADDPAHDRSATEKSPTAADHQGSVTCGMASGGPWRPHTYGVGRPMGVMEGRNGNRGRCHHRLGVLQLRHAAPPTC